MQKLIASCLFPLICCLILLTACNTLDEASELQGSILIWQPIQGENSEVFQDIINDFRQLNPGTHILSEYISRDTITTRFIQLSKTGLAATMVIDLARHIPQMVKGKSLQPLDKNAIDLSIYFPPTLPQIRYQEQIYGVPLASQLRVLCYNQAKLVTNDPTLSQPPFGLEGLIIRAQKGYSVGMVSTFEDTFWGMGIFGAKLFDDQGFVKPQLDGWVQWLQWLKKAANQPNFLLLRSREILHDAFAKGKLTYYVCNSDEISDLKNALQDNLRVAPLPGEPHRPATPLLYTTVMLLNRSASQNETYLALQLAKFATNTEQQLKAVTRSPSFIPTNQNVSINQQLLPIESVLNKQSKTAVAIPIDAVEKFILIIKEGDILYQKAMAGDITSDEAVLQLTAIVKEQYNHQER